MKALFFSEHGGMDVLRYGEVPTPEPGPGEVLVKVSACALNHLDVWVRRGWPGLKLPMPHWCGADVAGEVAGLGPGVAGWETGRRVVIDPGISTRQDEYTRRGADSLSPGYRILGEHIRGGAAEYVCVPAENLAEIPHGIDDTEAAAPLLVTLTAWRMLIRQARLRAGESVLIVGAGGGVNSMAIQVAKLAGAKVFVVAGDGEKARRAVGLGADEVIDRSRIPAWDGELYQRTGRRGVDVVVDNVGRATLQTSLRAAARGGRIVVVGNTSGPEVQMDLRYVFGKQLSIIGSTMGSHQDFRDVLALLWIGRLKPVIHRILPLSEGAVAYGIMERGEHFGKIVLIPRH
jgi:NADPH:quinone reductase-like Zn-dependent oxidoreductase